MSHTVPRAQQILHYQLPPIFPSLTRRVFSNLPTHLSLFPCLKTRVALNSLSSSPRLSTIHSHCCHRACVAVASPVILWSQLLTLVLPRLASSRTGAVSVTAWPRSPPSVVDAELPLEPRS
ncbi:hypothetical protein PIB30_054765 [Stylosanthes scabra]|uniref:Uncharacterized protein n=1 Tax=Stylosanthes scabra TaxID=79078 RepID=A0ABU6XGP1_9FABA|nr:hypothetical protein [Stylosanthes scabra]